MPLFVGIAGPSGAGKSTLAAKLFERLPDQVSILALDRYYVDLNELSAEERCTYNFDHPDAIDWERFFDDLMQLDAGKVTSVPVYDFCTHSRKAETCTVDARPIVLVEGLHVLWQPALRAMLNFKIYIEATQSECLRRRIDRDTKTRGRKTTEVIRQYREQTSPMFVEFIATSKEFADLVLNGEQDFVTEVEKLAARLL